MKRSITATASGNIRAQPDAATEELILVSSEAADTGNVTVYGEILGVFSSVTVALTGTKEVSTGSLFGTIFHVVSAAHTGTIYIRGQGTPAAAQIILSGVANNDTITLGVTGATRTYTFKTVIAGANDILIGTGDADATENLVNAITSGGSVGVDYGVGTVVHADLTAVWDGGTSLTLTDKLAASRQRAWANATTITAASVPAQLFGGANGTDLVTLAPSELTALLTTIDLTHKPDGITSTIDLAVTNLPANVTFISQPYLADGAEVALDMRLLDTPALTPVVEISPDGQTFFPALTTIPALSASTFKHVPLLSDGPIMYYRVKVDNSAGGARNISITGIERR